MRRPGGKKPLDEAVAADPKSAHTAAVALLARRDHSTADLRRKLAQRGYLPVAIDAALESLGASRLIDDARYGENLVAARARRGRGPRRIAEELRRSGVSAEVVEATLTQAKEEGPDFLALARAARARKFGAALPKDRKEVARQARFLQYRGFSTDHIRAVLEGPVEGAEDGEPDPP